MGFRFLNGIVIGVSDNGWAARNGIMVDDRLSKVNGKDIGADVTDEGIFGLLAVRPLVIGFVRKTPFEHYQVGVWIWRGISCYRVLFVVS